MSMRFMELKEFIDQAIEVSAFVAPEAHGLTVQELASLGEPFAFGAGEIADYFRRYQHDWGYEDGRMILGDSGLRSAFILRESEPEWRDVHSFEFVIQELKQLAKAHGLAAARIPRDVLLARAEHAGHARKNVEVALLMLRLDGHVELDKTEVVKLTPRGDQQGATPLEQYEANRKTSHPPRARKYFERLRPLVENVIARRTDGRPSVSDPLRAFADRLDQVNHASFRTWWMQIVGELERANPQVDPITVCVLSAALVEGALSLVIPEAIKRGAVTKELPSTPKQWKLVALLGIARSGRPPFFAQDLADRCDRLNTNRQRIHAGALLAEPGTYPRYDARPEDALEGRETAKAAVRRVLEWLSTL